MVWRGSVSSPNNVGIHVCNPEPPKYPNFSTKMTRRYNLYPTLLDALNRLISAPKTWETYWGRSETPSKTLEEYESEVRQQTLDTINRVKREPSREATLGTIFNELLDGFVVDELNMGMLTNEGEVLHVERDGFEYDFDTAWLCSLMDYYGKGWVCQQYVETILPTRHGDVKLYGYVDRYRDGDIVDIKTTGSYTLDKYAEGWQRHVYSLALATRGIEPREFRYDVFEWRTGEYLTAKQYREAYRVNLAHLQRELQGFLEYVALPLLDHFDRQGLITNRKVFNEQ